ncbi:MAG: transcription-repair coupling factor [Candidatus Rokubacteria bacterium 13_1_40CM_4_69_5]|nr:MAG: transcription-repair coupling factor [Candidatus Rokubacteria bacterium 13_1_40CM_4_69_5]OLE39555.1 MAG: transcription-repair coupling factor [Candidatus Rokubacteria bacterium 13_1_20CM_2_70_7]
MLRQWPPFDELAKAFAEGVVCLRVAGLTGSARALAVVELLHAHPRPALIVAASLAEARHWAQDLRFFGAPAVEFAEREPRLWRGGHEREADAERALICRRLLAGEPIAVVATPAALDVPLPAPTVFGAGTLRFSVGDSLDRELLLEALQGAGYERVDTVVEVGQWSVRGGIVDIFTPTHPAPGRLEFVGDEIESIRLFDPTAQRSQAHLDELVVLPLDAGGAPAETAGTSSLLEYLPAPAPVVVDSPRLLDEPTEEAPDRLPLGERLGERQRIELELVAGASGPSEFTLDTHSVGRYSGKFAQLAEELAQWRREGFRLRLVAADAHQADHLRQILHEHGLEALTPATLDGPEGLAIVVGECGTGFSIPALGFILLTETEMFGARRRTLKRPRFQRGSPLSAFTDLALGDLVVHEDHGIGRYLGLKTMSVGGREGDFLLLEYADGGQLYLPVERLDLISKYLGGDAGAARLDRLGGASWQRVKESVRAALRDMAEELLKLYARRAVAEGHGFSPDAPWQREFEAAFRFEETPDQLRAIEDAKRDMEAERPMDRLVAGDVGYGKTEVALRAAFKAVADGTQVAVLVPTTVLAQQHFGTFSERFAPFPARVELLSRFRAPAEQKTVIEGLRTGAVDVVIGTHRLLSKDVTFKNLGLLIIDEEHRFGVAHKERLKQFRASVDVLALTATPIPRTLYMSLSGVRDMSVIETPPLDRLPVETMIRRFSKAVIKEALERELARGGQVFFVHNRVQSLPSMTRLLQELVPDARIAMAHGQMRERELEAAMVKFVSGQADVLVSTAIVESGLDIPASNTIVVNRADRFGLAQLYQLRGRVGRERQQAYCYLLVPADGRVDEQAQRRLRALQELTELGSGFKLALRDLEIRGAGNLLGAQQHGHIAAVGFDLYSKLLTEAVRELRGEPAATTVEPVVSVDVEGFLPEDYVPEVNQRLALYKRLAGAQADAEVADLRAELSDRFGSLPQPAQQLLDIVRIRVAARALGIERIEAGEGRALVTFSPATPIEPQRLVGAIQRSRGRLLMKREFTLEATIDRGEWPVVRDSLLRLLSELARP